LSFPLSLIDFCKEVSSWLCPYLHFFCIPPGLFSAFYVALDCLTTVFVVFPWVVFQLIFMSSTLICILCSPVLLTCPDHLSLLGFGKICILILWGIHHLLSYLTSSFVCLFLRK
jgi:hypothetical protein